MLMDLKFWPHSMVPEGGLLHKAQFFSAGLSSLIFLLKSNEEEVSSEVNSQAGEWTCTSWAPVQTDF